jgi:hypothetical protein
MVLAHSWTTHTSTGTSAGQTSTLQRHDFRAHELQEEGGKKEVGLRLDRLQTAHHKKQLNQIKKLNVVF